MDYDIVVTGLGCAGLSFVYYLLNSPLSHQKILLIDNDPKQKNITWMHDSVKEIPIMDGKSVVITEKNGTITGKKIFNSIPLSNHLSQKPLKQVFLGWEIESNVPCFDHKSVTLMDFENGNTSETAFVYILPFSDKRGLVEYTLFNKDTENDQSLLASKL